MINMATICSGIGAPEVASIGLGYSHVFMAEIEPFPSAVLAHHWPGVPNLGDMTKIDGESWRGMVDVLVGGTPCQAFSVAGKRESLADERGNLTLKFVELCDAINPAYVVWENVPGVLSTADNAFGCFLGALSGNDGELFPAGNGWSNAGCVIGPRRKLAWRILDAQYFGLAQRRRRVFVVACPRDGADPCEILFEREGVQRHSAPSREKGKGFAQVAGTLSANRGGLDRPAGNANELDFCVPVSGGIDCRGVSPTLTNKMQGSSGWAPYNEDAHLVPVCMAHGQGNAEIVSVGSPSLTCNHEAPIVCQEVADTITNCFHKHHGASSGKDSLPRNHVLAFAQNQLGEVTATHAVAFNVFGGNKRKDRPEGGFYVEENPDASKALDAASGLNPTCSQGGTCVAFQTTARPEASEDVAYALRADSPSGGGQPQCVAFEPGVMSRCGGHVYEDQSGTLRKEPGDNQMCVAFHQNQRAEVTVNDTAGSLKVGGGKPGQGYPAVCVGYTLHGADKTVNTATETDVAGSLRTKPPGSIENSSTTAVMHGMQVRRLTPVECERLQGFPDNYTRIPWRKKPAEDCPDGPRYKALGNSMAVPVMRWILRRVKENII